MRFGKFMLAMLLGSVLTLIGTAFFGNRARADQEPATQQQWEALKSPDVAVATGPFESRPGYIVDDRNAIDIFAEAVGPNRTSEGNLVMNLGVAEYSLPYLTQKKTVWVFKVSHRLVISRRTAEQMTAVLKHLIDESAPKKTPTTAPVGGGL